MSWAGWEQRLCEKGHYNSANPAPFGNPEDNFKCWVEGCDGKLAWWNQVDKTNGGSDGYVKLCLKKKAVFCECPSCHTKCLKIPEEYHIPKTKGHRIKVENS